MNACPKVAWVCCTFKRPHMLGHLIHCFLQQDYPREHRSLTILDDAGEYENQSGDGWQLVSIPLRFLSLGQKRNAVAAMVPINTKFYCPVDDDDLYLPHAMTACAAALQDADLAIPSKVFQENRPGMIVAESEHHHHAAWGYRRWLFEKVGGYPALNMGEDGEFKRAALAGGAVVADPLALGFTPYFICTRFTETYHAHTFKGYDYRMIGDTLRKKSTLKIGPGYVQVGGQIALL